MSTGQNATTARDSGQSIPVVCISNSRSQEHAQLEVQVRRVIETYGLAGPGTSDERISNSVIQAAARVIREVYRTARA